MKKAKIMLTSIVVLAVVGGALAFKAQKFSSANVYCKQNCADSPRLLFTTLNDQDLGSTTEPCGANKTIYFSNASGCQIYTTTPNNNSTVYTAPNL